MPRKTEREFEKWFEEQFGERFFGPYGDAKLEREFKAAVCEYERTKTRYEGRLRWNLMRDSAHKAWLAKEVADAAD